MKADNVLSGVPDTTYIPLVARIYVSKRFPEYFLDKKALELEPVIPGDAIAKNSGEYECMASVARSHVMDAEISGFLTRFPQGSVVFLGGGLETSWNRVGVETAHCYQVDLTNVIKTREYVLGHAANEMLIAGDMLTMDWAIHVPVTSPVLFVVSGVWQYFHEEQVLQVISRLRQAFPQSELIFDATNSAGLKFTNRYVEKTGNKDAHMYFGIDDPTEFAHRAGVELLGVSGFFEDARKLKKKLSFRTRMFMYFSDAWGRTMLIHMRLNAPGKVSD